jgi:hypothetical protein
VWRSDRRGADEALHERRGVCLQQQPALELVGEQLGDEVELPLLCPLGRRALADRREAERRRGARDGHDAPAGRGDEAACGGRAGDGEGLHPRVGVRCVAEHLPRCVEQAERPPQLGLRGGDEPPGIVACQRHVDEGDERILCLGRRVHWAFFVTSARGTADLRAVAEEATMVDARAPDSPCVVNRSRSLARRFSCTAHTIAARALDPCVRSS